MRIIVTGSAGFIGSNLVRMLLGQGHQVLSIDKLTYAGNLASLADFKSNPKHRLIVADICDAQAMRSAFNEFSWTDNFIVVRRWGCRKSPKYNNHFKGFPVPS